MNRIYQADDCKEDIGITFEEYKNYIREWDNMPNGFFENGDEYISMFQDADLLITDSGSFIQEYLPSGNPCIYIFNNEVERNQMDLYYPSAVETLNTYYIVKTEDEIKEHFNNIIRNGEDSKKTERKRVASKTFKNIGCSGQAIADYIKKKITLSDWGFS
jgi:UDP-N-acetylglucosamine 2-epimerase